MITSNLSGVTGNPATSNGITMTINSTPAPTITGTTTICSGNSTTLTVSGGDTYSWNTGANSSSINVSPTTTTTYSVTATSAGCSAQATKIVNVTPTPATPTISKTGMVLTSSLATGNQWYNNGVIISGATNQNYTVTVNGNYTVIVTINNCPSAASAPVNIINTGVDQNFNERFFTIYPNPNDGVFTINFNTVEKSTYKIEIKNTIGQLIYQRELTNHSGLFTHKINISEYEKGLYMISITDANHATIKKVIVY
ncbi:MAG: T9SS type A sorting domain-containing protein [Bacteroidetes bacterium]|nr:T9SS type A sorting domain-containing protein [Bacteroidota bacterium]